MQTKRVKGRLGEMHNRRDEGRFSSIHVGYTAPELSVLRQYRRAEEGGRWNPVLWLHRWLAEVVRSSCFLLGDLVYVGPATAKAMTRRHGLPARWKSAARSLGLENVKFDPPLSGSSSWYQEVKKRKARRQWRFRGGMALE